MRENIPFPSFVKMLLSIVMEERSITKIYSQLESGVSGVYVTDYTQIEDAHLTKITYSELRALRDKSLLVPGHYYRITDYVTMCNASGLANNTVYYAKVYDILPFDVIIQATDTYTLSHDAMLAPRDGNNYEGLSKFKVKYDLDNDPSKYEFAAVRTNAYFYYSRNKYFATGNCVTYNNIVYYEYSNGTTSYYLPTIDPTTSTDKKLYRLNGANITATSSKFSYGVPNNPEGRGVIYYMQDEYGNEAPYDFINIAFVRYSEQSEIFTFSLNAGCTNNKIGCYYRNGALCLNTIFMQKECKFNIFEEGCYAIELASYNVSNRFGTGCNNIATFYDGTAAPYFQYNKFGDNCSNISLHLVENPSSARAARYLDVAAGIQGALILDNFTLGANHTTLILKDSNNNLIYSNLIDLINSSGINQIEITYEELNTLIQTSKLKPGVQYRITDYNTTVNSDNTLYTSAGHQFDIIVTADSEASLMEKASVIHHEGDTYFATVPLQSWEIKYCFKNDTSRFDWADPEGKGVIYYMRDEKNNECGFDFKNIKYKNKYTFHNIDDDTDFSLTPFCYGNIVKSIGTVFSEVGGGSIFSNIIEDGCRNITFGNGANNNIIGKQCVDFTIGNKCAGNTFNSQCSNINLGVGCSCNTFGDSCYNISIADSCSYNTFGDSCQNISIGTMSQHNTFGNICYNITFTNNGWYNVFGDGCYNIWAANHFQHNTFGAECNNIMFSKYNTSINNPTNYRGYCQYNKFDNGSSYIIIYKECEVCLSNRINNLNVLSGMSGSASAYLFLEIDNLNVNYEIFIGKNSSGVVKMFSLTDLIL